MTRFFTSMACPIPSSSVLIQFDAWTIQPRFSPPLVSCITALLCSSSFSSLLFSFLFFLFRTVCLPFVLSFFHVCVYCDTFHNTDCVKKEYLIKSFLQCQLRFPHFHHRVHMLVPLQVACTPQEYCELRPSSVPAASCSTQHRQHP